MEETKGTNHKKKVKAKWGDDDGEMQGLKMQRLERRRERKKEREKERERRKCILKGQQRVGANRINRRHASHFERSFVRVE